MFEIVKSLSAEHEDSCWIENVDAWHKCVAELWALKLRRTFQTSSHRRKFKNKPVNYENRREGCICVQRQVDTCEVWCVGMLMWTGVCCSWQLWFYDRTGKTICETGVSHKSALTEAVAMLCGWERMAESFQLRGHMNCYFIQRNLHDNQRITDQCDLCLLFLAE